MPLDDKRINTAKPGITPNGERTTKPYKMGDSGGLYLEVSPRGGKWWRLKYRFAGKEKRLSLGVYPEVSLSEARQRRDTFRASLADGIDPGEQVKRDRAAKQAEQARQLTATRLMLDSDGALSLRLGNRRLTLTPAETADLRAFLGATPEALQER